MIPTGLLGGSFNPAHRGHRKISIHAAKALDLDEIWWLVSPGNPLKDPKNMAPLAVRCASAQKMARGLPIRVTAIESKFHTLYTVDTLKALRHRFPNRQFIWLMGADNLAQFHRWRDWRKIAKLVPIAVIRRPGYSGCAHTAPAMGWLRRFVRPAGKVKHWTKGRLPALVLLTLPPEPISATSVRAANPDWQRKIALSLNPRSFRDNITRRPLP